jgi:hypothetical protein
MKEEVIKWTFLSWQSTHCISYYTQHSLIHSHKMLTFFTLYYFCQRVMNVEVLEQQDLFLIWSNKAKFSKLHNFWEDIKNFKSIRISIKNNFEKSQKFISLKIKLFSSFESTTHCFTVVSLFRLGCFSCIRIKIATIYNFSLDINPT